MIILMCDGSSAGNPGPSKIGAVIWRRSFEKTKKVTPDQVISESIGIGTNNDAEFQAVLKGLEVSQAYANHPVFIYSDSMLIVNQCAGKWKIKEPRMQEYKRRYDELCKVFTMLQEDGI